MATCRVPGGAVTLRSARKFLLGTASSSLLDTTRSSRSSSSSSDYSPDSKSQYKSRPSDPRIEGLGKELADEYAAIRAHYDTPKYPIVLAHGLFGFAELKLAYSYLPTIHYWHGIREALSANGVTVITATVPPSGSVEQRAAALGDQIAAQASGKSVSIIAHSMGGLDARYMASRLQPPSVDVKALVTVSTPHHGSVFADYVIDGIGPDYLPRIYHLWEQVTGLGTGAFSQLTRKFMEEEFNPSTPDHPGVRYFSYGAAIRGRPSILSPFRQSHRILNEMEGPNDGLVSVASSRWGQYQGTLVGVNHLDLINWSNRLKYRMNKLLGHQTFNAIALYLDIADMLAKEGL